MATFDETVFIRQIKESTILLTSIITSKILVDLFTVPEIIDADDVKGACVQYFDIFFCTDQIPYLTFN